MNKLLSTFTFKKADRSTQTKTWNYSNNYYGDQVCKPTQKG